MNDQWTFPWKKKPVTLTGDLKFRRKNNWFVTGTFCFVTGKNQKLSRALLQICKNCHGHFSFFTGILLAFLSRATSQFSRAKFGVFCHGHFFKITGTFSKSVTGKPKNVTGKKKHWADLFWIIIIKRNQRKSLTLFNIIYETRTCSK